MRGSTILDQDFMAQVATVLITCFISKDAAPPNAMGYSGPDKNSKIALGSKYVEGYQYDWLVDHSAMKMPSDDLREHVYKRIIMNQAKGMQHFGQYQIPSY
jgi:hypothetical protein